MQWRCRKFDRSFIYFLTKIYDSAISSSILINDSCPAPNQRFRIAAIL